MTPKRLDWYRKRLGRMSPAEIGYRGVVLLWWLGQWARLSIGGKTGAASAAPAKLSVPPGRAPARVPLRIFPPNAAGRLEPFADRITRAADAILAHDHTFFDRETINLGRKINWHYDYRNAIETPRTLACFIDFRDFSEVGDVKYVWEVSRQQHLVPLAMAFLLTGDQRYAAEVIAQIDDWIADNPRLFGINWASTENSALRIMNWIMALDLLTPPYPIAPEMSARIERSVREQVSYLTHNYSLFSSGNNHLLTELAAVYFAQLFFGIATVDARREIARRLETQALAQNHPDGVNREQALAYQGFIFDILYLPWCAAQTNGLDDFSPQYGARLERMASFIADTADTAFSHPAVGDEDSGRACWLGQNAGERTLSILNTAAAAWPPLEQQMPADRPADPKSALLGAGARLQPVAPVHRPPFVFREYPEGGYYLFRYERGPAGLLLVFDAGDLGFGPLAAHGHADALSVWLHIGDVPVFVDSGTHSYIDAGRRRKYKSTSQHNTLAFDGTSQSEYLDRFIWGARHQVVKRAGSQDERGAWASGEIRWATGETHARRVRFDTDPAVITIVDRWQGRIAPVIRFHLNPALEVRATAEGVTIAPAGFRLTLEASEPLAVERATISPRLYTEAETSVIAIRPPRAAGECTTRIRVSP